jgi:hypothetical protein
MKKNKIIYTQKSPGDFFVDFRRFSSIFVDFRRFLWICVDFASIFRGFASIFRGFFVDFCGFASISVDLRRFLWICVDANYVIGLARFLPVLGQVCGSGL